MSQQIAPTAVVRAIARKPRSGVLRRLLRNPLGVVTASILSVMILAAVLAPVLAPHDPGATDLANALAGPSADHLLGTDSAGRDVLSRLLFGAQLTFAAGALAALVSIAIGVPTGLVAGYYGGWFDAVSYWCSNMLMSLPGIIILLAARAAFGPSVWISMVIFGILFSPSFYRLVRTSVISVRNELYVDAARVSGLSDARIVSRHVLVVVRAPIIIQGAMIAGIAVGIQAGLEFLGLGDSGTPSWGSMLSEGFRNIYVAPLLMVWPSIALGLVTTCAVLFGNALRDTLEGGETVRSTPRRRRSTRANAVPTAQAGDAHLLDVQNVSIAYPVPGGASRRVVDGVGFHIDRGEVLGVVGESGSGKTQTAFGILGLLPDAAVMETGRIVIDGEVVAQGADSRAPFQAVAALRGRSIGYVPQEPMSNLDPNFTIGHQLTRPLVVAQRMSKAKARARALELLARVGIPDPERTFRAYPHEISGGMAQRVLIAGAISGKPSLLIADEPTTALDVTVQADVLDLLRELQQEMGMAILLVTHNFGVVADICDRVVVMRDARVVETGTVRSVLREPTQQYTRDLLAATLEGAPRRTPLLGTEEVVA